MKVNSTRRTERDEDGVYLSGEFVFWPCRASDRDAVIVPFVLEAPLLARGGRGKCPSRAVSSRGARGPFNVPLLSDLLKRKIR